MKLLGTVCERLKSLSVTLKSTLKFKHFLLIIRECLYHNYVIIILEKSTICQQGMTQQCMTVYM